MNELSWGWFSWGVGFLLILLVVLVLFSYIYFNPRKKGGPPNIDKKAGDEGDE